MEAEAISWLYTSERLEYLRETFPPALNTTFGAAAAPDTPAWRSKQLGHRLGQLRRTLGALYGASVDGSSWDLASFHRAYRINAMLAGIAPEFNYPWLYIMFTRACDPPPDHTDFFATPRRLLEALQSIRWRIESLMELVWAAIYRGMPCVTHADIDKTRDLLLEDPIYSSLFYLHPYILRLEVYMEGQVEENWTQIFYDELPAATELERPRAGLPNHLPYHIRFLRMRLNNWLELLAVHEAALPPAARPAIGTRSKLHHQAYLEPPERPLYGIPTRERAMPYTREEDTYLGGTQPTHLRQAATSSRAAATAPRAAAIAPRTAAVALPVAKPGYHQRSLNAPPKGRAATRTRCVGCHRESGNKPGGF